MQVYSSELNKRCQPHLKRTNKSYRVDKVHIKVKGQDKYLKRQRIRKKLEKERKSRATRARDTVTRSGHTY